MKWGERENEPFWNERPTVAKVNHYDDDEYDHHQWSSLHSGAITLHSGSAHTHTHTHKRNQEEEKEKKKKATIKKRHRRIIIMTITDYVSLTIGEAIII